MNPGDLLWVGVGAILSIMILSYLIDDNFLFRIASHIFLGISAGYLVILLTKDIVWPLLLQPFVIGNWTNRLWMIIPLAMILLLVLGQFPRFKGFSRLPLAFLTGVGAAIIIGGTVLGTLLPQSMAIIDLFDISRWQSGSTVPGLAIAEAIVMLLGVVGTLSYFHFGRKQKVIRAEDRAERPFVLESWGKVGQVFIGITLGAIFTGVFSTALTALIDRILAITQFVKMLFGGS